MCYYYYTEMPTVRFEAEQPLEVEESGGPVRVCARVNLGNEETIPVTFTTIDGTAKGMSSTCHFNIIIWHTLKCNTSREAACNYCWQLIAGNVHKISTTCTCMY